MKFYLEYQRNNSTKKIETDIKDCSEINNEDINIDYDVEENRIVVKLESKTSLKLAKACLEYQQDFNKEDHLFFNGYQSWSYSKEDDLNSYHQGASKVPLKKLVNNKFHLDRYADDHFWPYQNRKGYNRGWTYFYIRNQKNYKLFGSLNEDDGFTVFEYDKNKTYIKIIKDVEGTEINGKYKLFDIAIINGDENSTFDKYFRLLNIEKPSAKPMVGYTSWYNYYQNINEGIIARDLDAMANFKEHVDIFQIDDGFETYVGDWLDINPQKFPNGLKPITDKIHSLNMKTGLWLSPFTCETDSKIYKEHQDWLIKDENDKPYAGGCNWSTQYGLDIYNPEVREYIEKVFDTVFNTWNFDLVKLDFLYCACLKPIHGKNRGQIMADGMKWLRELCKGKLIIGCGVPLGSAFGRVDYCRIGCDVTLDYDDVAYMHLAHGERPSTKHSMTNTVFRRQLNGRAFLNDPDVFILRKDNTKLSESQKEDLAAINGLFGSLLFVSDNVATYDEKQLKVYKKTLNLKNVGRSIEEGNNEVKVSYSYDGDTGIVIINTKK